MDRSSDVLSDVAPGVEPRNVEGRGTSRGDEWPFGGEWSGRRDLNPRSPGPEPGAIPGFATSRHDAATRRGARSWLALRSRTECPTRLSESPQFYAALT